MKKVFALANTISIVMISKQYFIIACDLTLFNIIYHDHYLPQHD